MTQHNILPDLDGLIGAVAPDMSSDVAESSDTQSVLDPDTVPLPGEVVVVNSWAELRPATATDDDELPPTPTITPSGAPAVPTSTPTRSLVPSLPPAKPMAVPPSPDEQVAAAAAALDALRQTLNGGDTSVDAQQTQEALPTSSPTKTVSAALESQFKTKRRVTSRQEKQPAQRKSKTGPALQLMRTSDVTPPTAGPVEERSSTASPSLTETEYDEGWVPRRSKPTTACPDPAKSEIKTFAGFAERAKVFAADATVHNPDINAEMFNLVERVAQQGQAAARVQAKLRAFHTTAIAHQTAAAELSRCLADECDQFLVKEGNETRTPLARQAVVFQEFAALQREMTFAIGQELERIEGFLEDFAATKRAARTHRAAATKAASARDAFLSHTLVQGKATLTGHTHESRGLAAASAQHAHDEAQIRLIELLGQVGMDNHVGLIDAVQSVASASLKCATQVARVSIDEDRTALESSARDAALARHDLRKELQRVESEASELNRIDVEVLTVGGGAKATEELIKKAKEDAAMRASGVVKAPTCTFDSAFRTESDQSDAEFLEQARQPVPTTGTAVEQLIDSKVRPRASDKVSRKGVMLARERTMGMCVWRPSYFETHGFTLRKIDGKGRRSVVAKDLRNARLDAAPVQSDGSREVRPFVFLLVTADKKRHLLQCQSAREFTEWFLALEKMTQGVPVGNHDFSVEVEISA